MKKLVIVEGTGEISIGGGITVTGPILQPFYLDLYNISDLLARGLTVKEFIRTEKGSGFKVLNSSNYDKINTLLDSEINHAYDDYVPPKYPNEIEHIPTPPDSGCESGGIPINSQTLVAFVREVMDARGEYKTLYEKLNKEDLEDYDNVLIDGHTLKFFANGTLKKTLDLSELGGGEGVPGPQGPKGDPGEPFKISKIYASIEEMNKDFENPDVKTNSFVLINTGSVNDEDNAKLYVKGESEFQFLVDLSGKIVEGPQGPIGPVGPKGQDGAPGERGPQGETGAPGQNGADGKQIELRNDADTKNIQWRYVGTEEWHDLVSTETWTGKQGPQGEVGPQGPEGPVGPKGQDGAPGERGPQGETGAPGKDGAQGPKGDPGVLFEPVEQLPEASEDIHGKGFIFNNQVVICMPDNTFKALTLTEVQMPGK